MINVEYSLLERCKMSSTRTLSDTVSLLTLLNMKGVSRGSVTLLVKKFQTLDEVLSCSPEELDKIVSSKVRAALLDKENLTSAKSMAYHILLKAEKLDVEIYTFLSPEYPALLKKMADPAPIIYVRGVLPKGINNVACVGTREPTGFGSEVTKRLVRYLVENGFGIVSGLAIGVDTLSHQEALDAGGHTIAILANGLNTIYPKQNEYLAEKILEAGGALISEQPFSIPASPYNLVQRDRLQCGMSLGTVVMQTDIKGGTMHTVRFTLLQKRKLFVPVPPEQFKDEPKSQGLIALINNKGPQLASIIKADGKFKLLLDNEFAHSIVATPITGRSDYHNMLNELNQEKIIWEKKLSGTSNQSTVVQPSLF